MRKGQDVNKERGGKKNNKRNNQREWERRKIQSMISEHMDPDGHCFSLIISAVPRASFPGFY